jgi:aerobic-type carbon monoxide dehydrogenase small subunit (CoxS/CutS family)
MEKESKDEMKRNSRNKTKTGDSHSPEVSRRDFLKTSVTAATLLAAAAGLKSPQQIAPPPGPTPKGFVQGEIVEPGAKRLISLNVNGKDYAVQVEMRDMLVNVLRENIGLTGTKRPCNRMECGGCTVLIDAKPYYSCTYPAVRAIGRKILTTEGGDQEPVLSLLQDVWHEEDASQCGHCQPGQLMSATALLKSNQNPTREEIKLAMSGNLCRCGTYMNIIEAIGVASKRLRGVG